MQELMEGDIRRESLAEWQRDDDSVEALASTFPVPTAAVQPESPKTVKTSLQTPLTVTTVADSLDAPIPATLNTVADSLDILITATPETVGESLLTACPVVPETSGGSRETQTTASPETIAESLLNSVVATAETTRQAELTLSGSLALSNPERPDHHSISGLAEFEAQHAAGTLAEAEVMREVDADPTTVSNSSVDRISPVHGPTLDTVLTPQVQPLAAFFADCLGGIPRFSICAIKHCLICAYLLQPFSIPILCMDSHASNLSALHLKFNSCSTQCPDQFMLLLADRASRLAFSLNLLVTC